tara:strand:+ start:3920 stop:4153 length:234 start_codon:yes stop_codon:yes gene_type:complete
MKKLYLVHGSEDGTLGIFSNVKRAYERAIQYGDDVASSDRKVESYAKVCKALKRSYLAYVVESSYAESQIEMFYLNQ